MSKLKILTPEEMDKEYAGLLKKQAMDWMSVALVSAYYAAGGSSEDKNEAFRTEAFKEVKRLAEIGSPLTPALIGKTFARIRPT